MYKSCSRCGAIHDTRYKCPKNARKIDYSRYGTSEEGELRHTSAWQKKSLEIREKAQYLCEVCRDRGIFNYNLLEVHHITKLRDNAQGLLVNDNLICLCVAHHKQADAGMLDADYLRELARKREEISGINQL